MKKTLLVVRHEIITVLSRKSFLFAMFGIPLLGALIFGAVAKLNKTSFTDTVKQIFTSQGAAKAEGYVDLGGIIREFPEDFPKDTLVAYPDEASARAALEAGQIAAYYIISENYIESGKITYIRPDFNPIAAMGKSYMYERLLRFNLLGGDVQMADRLSTPFNLETKSLAPEPVREQSNPMTTWLPYGVMMIFYIVIMGAASLLLSSVTKEKETRVIEILMSSITPRQILVGKILGLGLVGLLQIVLWLGTSYLLLRMGETTFNISAAFRLPVSFLAWAIVFFVLGYAVYASLMAGLGALVPNMREATQATFVVIMPMIVPLMFWNILTQEPNGVFSKVLCLFPLTAPIAIITCLSTGGVVWWVPPVSAVLLAIAVFFIVRAVAGMFHAQTILSGQPFNVKRFFAALMGRA